MTDVLPDPLTPPDCDLTGLPFMPMDLARVLDSDLFALATGDEFKAAFALWAKAWSQKPAGSLPNQPRVLARLAGVSLGEWTSISAMALHQWRSCNDGRLYHPVVCEKALESWTARLSHQKRSAAGNAKRYKTEFDPAPFDEAILRAAEMRKALTTQPSFTYRNRVAVAVGANSAPSRSDSGSPSDPTGMPKGSEERETVEEIETSKEGSLGEGPRKRGSRLPQDWEPDADLIAYGVSLGFTHAKVVSIAERFRLHWHASSGRNAVKLSWGKAFQGWLRDDADRLPAKPKAEASRYW